MEALLLLLPAAAAVGYFFKQLSWLHGSSN
jgi:hypothetical protein